MDKTSRIGLVLGAGGPVGHAFHAGALLALHQVHRWDARDAALVVGTSAGAQVGALLRAGLSPSDLLARVTGAALSAEGAPIVRHYTRPDPRRPVPDGPRGWRPASLAYLTATLRRPWAWRPGPLTAALLPEGRASLHPQAEGFRRMFASSWPEEPLWITASHLESGRRVVFGRNGASPIDVGTAVTASGAVPGIWAPITVDGARYVDGGIHSPTHLDLVEQASLDAVIVSSPLSRFGAMRQLLRREVHRVRRRGVPVICLEPCSAVMSLMGYNPLDPARGPSVARAAYGSVARVLELTAGGAFTLAHR